MITRLTIDNNPIVSIKELNQILDHVERHNHHDLDIYFQNSIQKIDIVFIAGLILCNQKSNTKFEISYKVFPTGRLFEVRQYLKQFNVVFKQNWSDTFSKIQDISDLGSSDYVASKSFAPIILVTEDTIDKFFTKINESEIGTELFDLCQKYINYYSSKPNLPETEYLNSERSVVKKLSDYPPIYTFVFKVLYNKIAPFVKTKQKGIKDPIQRTEELWAFTKEYVKGIHELAKNIVEHSDTKIGMITIRAYDDEETEEVNVLETHVFDFGTKGIVSKLLEETTKNKDTNKIYAEDLEILNGTFEMSDFIKPTITKKLNQQLYRDLAHYGLMKFYKLIARNMGIIVSSSKGKNGGRDFYSSSIQHSEKAITLGTSYFFQLPFKPELFQSIDTVSSFGDMQASPQTISGLSELMNFRIAKDINEIPVTNLNQGENGHKSASKTETEKYLMCFELTNQIKNRNDELELFKLFKVLEGEKRVRYFAIDMNSASLSASSLLRFLAHLSSNYSQSIIVYNLSFELYDEMIGDNEEFYRTLRDLKANIPYWYENKGILIYSKLNKLNFNFADILYGNNNHSFRTINYIVSHTFPNTTTSITQDYQSNGEVFEVPNCLKSFFYQSSLLPFDLLLCNEDNKTLFQSNLETLISQDLLKNQVK